MSRYFAAPEWNVSKDVLKKFLLAEYAGEHWVGHARFEGVLGNAEQVIAIGDVIYPRGKEKMSISTSSKCNNLRPTSPISLRIGSFLHTFSLPSLTSSFAPSFCVPFNPTQDALLDGLIRANAASMTTPSVVL